MVAVPGNLKVTMEFQDNRGYRAITIANTFIADLTGAGAAGATLADIWAATAAFSAAVAAASNSKLVRVGWGLDADYAQEPTSETGVYELVTQKARLDFGDGAGGFMHMSVPAPKDALFLTSADNNLIVVNPAAGILTAIQAAGAGLVGAPPRGGTWGAQFFGGQLVQGKPRIRRVLQGA